MKNTITAGQRHLGIGQRIRWDYLSLAAGVALAASAGFGIAAKSGGETTSDTGKLAISATRPAMQQDQPSVVFYIVGDRESAARIELAEEDAARIRYASGSPETARFSHVLLASNEDEASAAARLIDQSMAAANFTSTEAPRFVVVDLR